MINGGRDAGTFAARNVGSLEGSLGNVGVGTEIGFVRGNGFELWRRWLRSFVTFFLAAEGTFIGMTLYRFFFRARRFRFFVRFRSGVAGEGLLVVFLADVRYHASRFYVDGS